VVRNPIYWGNVLIGAGFSVMAWALVPFLPVAFVLFLFLQYYLIILLEERELSQLFGETYAAYCRRVPRFFPRLNSAQGEAPVEKADVRGALASERRTFQTLIILSLCYVVIGFARGTM
jgi:hypothetical protein